MDDVVPYCLDNRRSVVGAAGLCMLYKIRDTVCHPLTFLPFPLCRASFNNDNNLKLKNSENKSQKNLKFVCKHNLNCI